MTTASKITLVRVAFIPLFMLFMYLSGGAPGLWMWLSLAVFIIASLTDYVDGHIARKYNQITDFGKFLDPLADKLLVIAAMAMLTEWLIQTAHPLLHIQQTLLNSVLQVIPASFARAVCLLISHLQCLRFSDFLSPKK